MLRIRLTRTGRRKQPRYRVVIAESAAPRDGRFLEIVGHYDPLADPAVAEVKADRVEYWLSKGAQPSETVHRLLARQGLMAPYQSKRRQPGPTAERERPREAEAAAEVVAASDETGE